jgi:hypothetical protein
MQWKASIFLFASAINFALFGALPAVETEFTPTNQSEFRTDVKPFFENFCVDCHNESGAEADFRVDNLDGDVTAGQDIERWEKALEMISIADMPPEDADAQPEKSQRRQIVAWITTELKKIGRGPDEARLNRPEFGNRVDHEDLFSGEYAGPAYSPSRLWRKNPHIYNRFESSLRLGGGTSPFAPKGGAGFQDYSLLLANEATIKAMRINASNYAAELLEGKLIAVKDKGGKPIKDKFEREGKSRYHEFSALLDGEVEISSETLQPAVKKAFELLLYRPPNELEAERYQAFLQKAVDLASERLALEYLLTAIMLSPEFVYRQELGLGEELPDGRRMLSPEEIAYAIAFALTDSPPDAELETAVAEGRLSTKKDVEREVRRMLDTSTKEYWKYEINHTFQSHVEACPNPRILRFFREFFGYSGVFDVFKDETRNPNHKPQFIFKDADLFVLAILEKDKQVFRELLTSDLYVVHYVSEEQAERKMKQIRESIAKNKQNQNEKNSRKDPIAEKLEKGLTPVLGSYRGGHYYTSYNLEKETWDYPLKQPFRLPNRAGMLTHPA